MITINFSELKVFLEIQAAVVQEIETGCDALTNIETVFSQSQGEFIESLRLQKDNLRNELYNHGQRIKTAHDKLDYYIESALFILKPLNEEANMTIDKSGFKKAFDDIKKELKEMFAKVADDVTAMMLISDEKAEINQQIISDNTNAATSIRVNYADMKTFTDKKIEELEEIYKLWEQFEQRDEDHADSMTALYNEIIGPAIRLGEANADFGSNALFDGTTVAFREGGKFLWDSLVYLTALVSLYKIGINTRPLIYSPDNPKKQELEEIVNNGNENIGKFVSGIGNGIQDIAKDPGRGFGNVAKFMEDGLDAEAEEYGYEEGSLASSAFVVGGFLDPLKVGKASKLTKGIKIARKLDMGTLKVVGKTEKLKRLESILNKENPRPSIAKDADIKTLRQDILGGEKASLKEYREMLRLRNGQTVLKNGRTLEEMAGDYARNVNTNTKWSWIDDMPDGELVSGAERTAIKDFAVREGLIPAVPTRTATHANGKTYTYADFKSAGLVRREVDLPKSLWSASDSEQFRWLDEQIGGRPPGTTWHHNEVNGKMQLIDFGIHNVTNHNGGRTLDHWAYRPEGR